MAFPQVSDADTQSGVQTSNSTSWTCTFPTNIAAGDLLLAFFGIDGAGPRTASATDWSNLVSEASDGSASLDVLYKDAVGTETGNFTATISGSEQGCWRTIRIPAASWWGVVAEGVAVANTTGSGLTPDPSSLNPSGWDIEDTLWIAAAASDHGDTTYTLFPLNYTNTSAQESGGAGGAALGIARLESAVASENPGAFTTDASEGWVADTIAIRPAAAAAERVPRSTSYPQLLAN